jgi:hypothetical protein
MQPQPVLNLDESVASIYANDTPCFPLGSDDLTYILVAAALFYAQYLHCFSSKPVYANLHALSSSETQLVVFTLAWP